jgi:hypothetical protein
MVSLKGQPDRLPDRPAWTGQPRKDRVYGLPGLVSKDRTVGTDEMGTGKLRKRAMEQDD